MTASIAPKLQVALININRGWPPSERLRRGAL